MSTYNMGFYEDLTKIIFQLSSNMHLISSSDSKISRFHIQNFKNSIFKHYHKLSSGQETIIVLKIKLSSDVRKPVFGVFYRSDTNQAVQPQKMVRGLKFWI